MSIDPLEDKRLVDFLARHFVAYEFEYETFNDDGSLFHRERKTFSGFVLEMNGVWFWATAGHCLDTLNQLTSLASQGKARLSIGGFIDFLGWEATEWSQVPYVYRPEDTFSVDEELSGLDFGLLYLDSNIRRQFEFNKVVPFTRNQLAREGEQHFAAYMVQGVPEGDPDNRELFLVVFERILLSDIDVSVLKNGPPSVEYFFGRLRPNSGVPTMVGISGGPIIGIMRLPDDKWSYKIVAMQSRWLEKQRVLYGCPLYLFADDLDKAMRDALRNKNEESTET